MGGMVQAQQSTNFKQTPGAEKWGVEVVGSSTFGRYSKISAARTVNMFMSDNWLINFSGWQKAFQLLDTSLNPIVGEGRGIFHSVRGNLLIIVVGSLVYRLDVNFIPTFIGNIATTTGEVFMDENLNNQICLVDGQNAYIYNYATVPSLVAQTNGDLGNGNLLPNYVCFHDTYFLFGNGNKTNNGAAWYAYSFNTASSPSPDNVIIQTVKLALQTKPDYAIAIRSIPGQANNVLVFGTTVCEIQTNVNTPQIYRRNSNINIDFGCISVSTIAASDSFVMWVGVNESNSPVIMQYSGQTAEAISTDGIDYLMGEIQFPEQSTALFYRQDGHLFYQLTFFNPADNITLLYDTELKKFYDLTDNAANYHPARKVVYFLQNDFFISLNNGAVYQINSNFTFFNENLTANTLSPDFDPLKVFEIPRMRICEPIRKGDSGRFIANTFVFTMDQGNDPYVTGISINQAMPNLIITEDTNSPPDIPMITENSNDYIVAQENNVPEPYGSIVPYLPPTYITYIPRVDMSISQDSGITYGNTVSRYLNPQGIRKNIITFDRLGMCNDLVIKLRFWGLSNFIISNGELQIY